MNQCKRTTAFCSSVYSVYVLFPTWNIYDIISFSFSLYSLSLSIYILLYISHPCEKADLKERKRRTLPASHQSPFGRRWINKPYHHRFSFYVAVVIFLLNLLYNSVQQLFFCYIVFPRTKPLFIFRFYISLPTRFITWKVHLHRILWLFVQNLTFPTTMTFEHILYYLWTCDIPNFCIHLSYQILCCWRSFATCATSGYTHLLLQWCCCVNHLVATRPLFSTTTFLEPTGTAHFCYPPAVSRGVDSVLVHLYLQAWTSIVLHSATTAGPVFIDLFRFLPLLRTSSIPIFSDYQLTHSYIWSIFFRFKYLLQQFVFLSFTSF